MGEYAKGGNLDIGDGATDITFLLLLRTYCSNRSSRILYALPNINNSIGNERVYFSSARTPA